MSGLFDAITAKWVTLHPNVRGALWLLLSGFCFTFMGTMVKVVAQEGLHPFQIAFFRCLFGLVVILPLIPRMGEGVYLTKRPMMHLLRAVVGISAMFCIFYALSHLELATATAISFSKPLFMIILAVLFLGEVVRIRRWVATAVGFGGVLVMMRPFDQQVEFAMLVAVAAALLVAMALTIVKKLSETEKTFTILLYFTFIASILSFIPALIVWQTPTWQQFVLMVMIGALGSLAQSMLIRGYTVGEATAVAPFDYCRLIFMAVAGFIVFGEFPDVWKWVGAAIIVGSTLYIVRRAAKVHETKRVRDVTELPGSVDGTTPVFEGPRSTPERAK